MVSCDGVTLFATGYVGHELRQSQPGIYKEVFVSKGLYELVVKLLGLLHFVADKVEKSARSAHKPIRQLAESS